MGSHNGELAERSHGILSKLSTNNVYDMQLVVKSRRHTIYSPKPQHAVWNKMSDGEIGTIQDWL